MSPSPVRSEDSVLRVLYHPAVLGIDLQAACRLEHRQQLLEATDEYYIEDLNDDQK